MITVEIHGLTTKKYNGRRGLVVAKLGDRLAVELEDRRVLQVRPANVREIGTAEPDLTDRSAEVLPGLWVGDIVAASRAPRVLCVAAECGGWLRDTLDERLTFDFPDPGSVLVHCVQGKSRSVAVVLIIMVRRGLTLADAWHRVKSKRPCAQPNTAFVVALLREYGDASLAETMGLTERKLHNFRQYAHPDLLTYVDDVLLPSLRP